MPYPGAPNPPARWPAPLSLTGSPETPEGIQLERFECLLDLEDAAESLDRPLLDWLEWLSFSRLVRTASTQTVLEQMFGLLDSLFNLLLLLRIRAGGFPGFPFDRGSGKLIFLVRHITSLFPPFPQGIGRPEWVEFQLWGGGGGVEDIELWRVSDFSGSVLYSIG